MRLFGNGDLCCSAIMLIKEAARSAKYSSVAVIGGGIGGLSVANALLRKNVAARVSVYEQAKEFVPTVRVRW